MTRRLNHVQGGLILLRDLRLQEITGEIKNICTHDKYLKYQFPPGGT